MDLDLVIKTLNDEGKVVALKTDTVYGIVCNAFDKKAVKKIYDIKKRESRKPLSIFIKSVDEIEKIVDSNNLTSYARDLMNKFWPGALTIIFKKKDDTFNHLNNNSGGIGIRIPDDKDLRYILDNIDFPLAQTSCNISGEKEYKSAIEIEEKLGNDIDLIVDGGEIINSKPSTVLSLESNEPKILRVGAVKIDG